MGACDLTFDRIVVQNQKSDSQHYDTDWLHVVWFAGGSSNPQVIGQTTFPLLNVQGSFQLHTGDLIPPITLACNANDSDVVMAVYAITNLGSSDYSDQVNQATEITSQIAQKAADAYLYLAKSYLEGLLSELPGGTWIDAVIEKYVEPNWSAFLDAVNGLIDQVFQNVIAPLIGWLTSEVQNILGAPDCNGEVLHDFVIFVPNNTNDGSLQRFYTGTQENSSCGEAPHTEVDITLHREVPFIGQFGPVIQQSQSDLAAEEFRNRAQVATQEGYVGAFPNFYYATYGQANVGGTIFIKPACGDWEDVQWSDLNFPPLDQFSARIRATDIYATSHGYAGGFPNFFQAQRLSGLLGARSAFATSLVDTAAGSASPFLSVRSRTSLFKGPQFITVCGTVLIKLGCATRREIPLVDLPSLSDIGALFRAVQDYATNNGFVGGFPTYNFPASGLGVLKGRGPMVSSMFVVLLPAAAAVWQDVVLYWNPN